MASGSESDCENLAFVMKKEDTVPYIFKPPAGPLVDEESSSSGNEGEPQRPESAANLDPASYSSELGDTSAESLSTGKSSTSTLRSSLSVSTITSKKVKNAARKKSLFEKRKEKKRIKKIEKNKIDKDDFYSKHSEFRTWLWEAKGLKFETMSASKAKDYFKKFTKKWNSKKLPKQYYRGIDTCWFDGSPATQSLWAMPRQVEMTPGSLREEALDEKYSRQPVNTSSLGTFGKRSGRRALQELQQCYPDTFLKPSKPDFSIGTQCETDGVQQQEPSHSRDVQCVQKTSSSSLPESFTRPSRPKAPKRASSLTNMVSSSLTEVFEDDLTDKCDGASRSVQVPAAFSKKRSLTSTTGCSVSDISPGKWKKQDSYVKKVERASPSVFQALKISSGRKKGHASVKQRPKSLCDSRMFQSLGQSDQLSSKCSEDSFRKSAVLSLVDGVCTPSKW